MKHNKTFYVVVERKERKYRQNYRQWLLDNKLRLKDQRAMKKIFVLILVMASCAFASVTFVRDPMSNGMWYAYVPDQSNPGYYTRYEMTLPMADDSTGKLCFMGGIAYGRVMQGLCIVPSMTSYWVESGTWTAATSLSSTNDFAYNIRETSTQNSYVDITIPTGYDRISLVYYASSTSSSASVECSWGEATPFKTISMQDTISRITEVVLLTGNTNSGALRIKKVDATSTSLKMRIIAVRCFNTSLTGDPATLFDDGLYRGDDIIDCAGSTTSGYIGRCSWPGYLTQRVNASEGGTGWIISPSNSTNDFAVALGGATKGLITFWGGQNHVFGTNNTYQLDSTLTDGPIVYVDTVSAGGVWSSSNPIRTVKTGERIVLSSYGTSDWWAGVNNCETQWTASANVTTYVQTIPKVSGTYSARSKVAAAFSSGLISYYNILSPVSITAFSASSSVTKITAPAHGRITADWVKLTGTPDGYYDGLWSITRIDNDNFTINKTYVAKSAAGSVVDALTDLSAYSQLCLLIMSDRDIADGILQLVIDDSYDCASPIRTIDLPALTANEHRYIYVTLTTPSELTSIASIGLYAKDGADRFTLETNIYTDNIYGVYSDSPLVNLAYTFDKNGCSINGSMYFRAAVSITTSYYCPMLSIGSTLWGLMKYRTSTNGTLVSLPTSDTTISSYSTMDFVIPQYNCMVRLTTTQPNVMYMKYSTSKIYCQNDVESMPFDISSAAGAMCSFGGRIDISRYNSKASWLKQ